MRILCSAESFGYGPITTELVIIKELKKYQDVILDFIGSDGALEQAKMSNYFDNYYNCHTFDETSLKKYKDIFKNYDVFLSIENPIGAIFALNHGIDNTYYVDNLMWMWDKIPERLNDVKKYFISETIPCKDNYNRIGKKIKHPIFVGPVRNFQSPNYTSKNQLIINIGGAESFLLDRPLIEKFYNKILNDILSLELISKIDSIIICGGKETINKLKLKCNHKNIKKCTLSYEEYLKEMGESRYCILSPGLGNFIETLTLDKEIMYLPSINYSQHQQLEFYKEKGFGFTTLDWSEFDFYKDIPKYLDEETGVKLVNDNIEKYLNGNYEKVITNVVNRFINNSQKQYFKIRNNFAKALKSNAAKEIAEIIYDENK